MTVNTSVVATFFWEKVRVGMSGVSLLIAPYISLQDVVADPSTPVTVFPHRCILEEFRIQPLNSWDPMSAHVRVILDIDGVSLIRHQIDVLGPPANRENSNRLFNLNKHDTLSPGAFCHINITGTGNPADEQNYQMSMWGTWIR